MLTQWLLHCVSREYKWARYYFAAKSILKSATSRNDGQSRTGEPIVQKVTTHRALCSRTIVHSSLGVPDIEKYVLFFLPAFETSCHST